jgi:LAO/AO transport system ATPase
MDEALLQAFQRGDRRALARLLTRAARGHGYEFLDRLPAPAKPSRVVAITGSGGVGKSTLIGKLIEHIRKHSRSVAVLACDPQSPLSGGALLGDRFRMPSLPNDEGVFIRSVVAESGHGALARHLPAMVRLLESFGFDIVLIETAGAGQGDTAVREFADVVVLLLQPETGDDLQWEKAGVLEVADIVAIHKADLPGADSAAAQVRLAMDLVGVSSVPVLKVSARTEEGMSGLWDAIGKIPKQPRQYFINREELLGLIREELDRRIARATNSPALAALLDDWQRKTLSRDAAAASILRLLSELPPSES